MLDYHKYKSIEQQKVMKFRTKAKKEGYGFQISASVTKFIDWLLDKFSFKK